MLLCMFFLHSRRNRVVGSALHRKRIHRRSLRLRRRGTPLLLGSDAPGLAHFRSLGALPPYQFLLGSRHRGVVVVCHVLKRAGEVLRFPRTRGGDAWTYPQDTSSLCRVQSCRGLSPASPGFSSCLHLVTKEALAGDSCQPRDECQPGDGRRPASWHCCRGGGIAGNILPGAIPRFLLLPLPWDEGGNLDCLPGGLDLDWLGGGSQRDMALLPWGGANARPSADQTPRRPALRRSPFLVKRGLLAARAARWSGRWAVRVELGGDERR